MGDGPTGVREPSAPTTTCSTTSAGTSAGQYTPYGVPDPGSPVCVESGVVRQRHLDRRTRECPPDPPLVGGLDRHLQVGGRLRVALRVHPVGAQQPHVDVVEAFRATELGEQGAAGEVGLRLDVQTRQGKRHAVAVPAHVVERHLRLGRCGLAPHAAHPHPVRPHLLQPDRVEARDGVGVHVGRGADLVQQLGGDGADGDQSAGAVVLGDDARPVPRRPRRSGSRGAPGQAPR